MSRLDIPCATSFPARTLQKLNKQRLNQQHTDFVLETQDEQLPCHKAILAASSKVFERMLSVNMKEAATNHLQLMGYNPHVLSSVLEYFYTGSFSVDTTDLQDAVQVCDYLELAELKANIVEHIPSSLQDSNLLSWQRLAKQHRLEHVTTASETMMKEKFSDITKTSEFLALELPGVIECLKTCAASVHQDELVKAVCRWLQHDSGCRTEHGSTLFQRLHIEECSATFLIHVLANYSPLLSSGVLQQIQAALNKMAQSQSYLSISNDTASQRAGAQLAKRLPDGKALMIGGGDIPRSNKKNSSFWILDAFGNCKLITNVPENLATHPYNIFGMPQGLGITGEDGKNCSVYNAKNNIWSELPRYEGNSCLSFCHQDRICTFTQLKNERTKCLFYQNLNQQSQEKKMWDGKWCEGRITFSSRSFSLSFSKMACISENVYLASYKSLYVLQYSHNNSYDEKLVATLTTSSDDKALVAVLDRLFLMGGRDKVCYAYTPATNTWETKTGPPLHSVSGDAIYCADHIYLFGGSEWDELQSVQRYNIATNKWDVMDLKMPAPLRGHKVMLVDTSAGY